jgi:preprotein translocase subunit SecD
MNKYASWKYVVIAIALVVAFFYALPNLFGEVPAVQISGLRTNKVDATIQAAIEEALTTAKLGNTGIYLDGEAIKVRFATTDEQLKARDIIQTKVGPGYVVALNLLSDSPAWLRKLGAQPMYLGLDLRGGVHFLMQVDMKTAMDKAVDRYLGDIRSLMRDKKIYHNGLSRESFYASRKKMFWITRSAKLPRSIRIYY